MTVANHEHCEWIATAGRNKALPFFPLASLNRPLNSWFG